MKSPYILINEIEKMIDKGYSIEQINAECEAIRKTWTLWWKIKRFFGIIK